MTASKKSRPYLNKASRQGVIYSNGVNESFRILRYADDAPICYLTLSQTSPGFYVSSVEVL